MSVPVEGAHQQPASFGALDPELQFQDYDVIVDAAFITGCDFLMDGGVTASYFYGDLAPM